MADFAAFRALDSLAIRSNYTYLLEGNVVSSQYLGVRAGLAPAQVGNRKGLPLLFEKIRNVHV
jgi:hypothetical protein